MATYNTKLAGTVGNPITGWTSRWNAIGTSVDYIAEANGFDDVSVRWASGGTNQPRLMSWDSLDADASRDDVDVYTRFKASGYNANLAGITPVIVRGADNTSGPDGYAVQAGSTNVNFRIRRYLDGAESTLASTSYSFSSNAWYWIRFQVRGSDLKAKVWPEADGGIDGEPAAWTLETTDTNVTAAGWIGFGRDYTSYNHDHDYFAVGTGLDDADTSDITAQALRVTLTQMQVLVLDPVYVPVYVPGRVRLTWTEDNATETEIRVYHDTTTIDTGAPPSVLATLPPDSTTYDHIDTFLAGEAQHYRVSTFKTGAEMFSSELIVTPLTRATAKVVMVTTDDTHGAAVNTKQALLDAGFVDAKITVLEDGVALPAEYDVIVVARGGATGYQPILDAFAAGKPVLFGMASGVLAGSGETMLATRADLTGTYTVVDNTPGVNSAVFTDNSHPITSGQALADTLLWDAANWGTALDSGASYVGTALATGDPGSALTGLTTLIAVEKGTLDLLGNPTAARAVVWPNLYGGQGAYNATGAELLGKMVDWCLRLR